MDPFQISDLLVKILAYIEDAKTYKICRLVSSSWLTAVGNDRIDEFANHLETIVELYPDMDWNAYDLSKNPSISINFIKKYKHVGWDYYRILNRNNIDLEDIQEIFPLYFHDNVKYINTSKDPNTNLRYFVIKNISLHWDPAILNVEMLDGFWLSQNKNLTIEHFKSMKGKITFYYDQLFCNSNLYWQDVLAYDSVSPEWNWSYISANPNITIDEIYAHRQKKWNWYTLSNNTPFFQTGPMNIIWEFITSNLKYNWNWDWLSEHISWDIIVTNLDNPKYEWNWKNISVNWTVTPKIIEENLHFPWNWNWISFNSNLTFRFIIKHKDQINFRNLAINTFDNFSRR